jgi:hypothetical protein
MFGGPGTGTAGQERPDAEGVFADVFEEVSQISLLGLQSTLMMSSS